MQSETDTILTKKYLWQLKGSLKGDRNPKVACWFTIVTLIFESLMDSLTKLNVLTGGMTERRELGPWKRF